MFESNSVRRCTRALEARRQLLQSLAVAHDLGDYRWFVQPRGYMALRGGHIGPLARYVRNERANTPVTLALKRESF
jgi:hypothetical protein